MSDLHTRAAEQKYELFANDLFSGIPLPVTERRPEDIRTVPPSRLIDIALDDLEMIEESPIYKVDMTAWHEPALWRCSVCLAGCVISTRFGGDHFDNLYPDDFDGAARNVLVALDAFRVGDIGDGLALLRYPAPDAYGLPLEVPIADYGHSPVQFKSDMRGLAAMFREAGI
jgi:hypothetical protein